MPVVIKIVVLMVLLFSWGAMLEMAKHSQKAADKDIKGLMGEGTLLALIVVIVCSVILIKG